MPEVLRHCNPDCFGLKVARLQMGGIAEVRVRYVFRLIVEGRRINIGVGGNRMERSDGA